MTWMNLEDIVLLRSSMPFYFQIFYAWPPLTLGNIRTFSCARFSKILLWFALLWVFILCAWSWGSPSSLFQHLSVYVLSFYNSYYSMSVFPDWLTDCKNLISVSFFTFFVYFPSDIFNFKCFQFFPFYEIKNFSMLYFQFLRSLSHCIYFTNILPHFKHQLFVSNMQKFLMFLRRTFKVLFLNVLVTLSLLVSSCLDAVCLFACHSCQMPCSDVWWHQAIHFHQKQSTWGLF
jgi:hypothetical protein